MKSNQNAEEFPTNPHKLEQRLAAERHAETVRRADELERLRAKADHARALADLEEEQRRIDRNRSQREASAAADADLARLRRQTRAEGARIKVAVTLARTVEARSKELAGLRGLNRRVLVPLFVAAGGLSTTGVHEGAVRLMHISHGNPYWWALWGLEPLLLGIAGFSIYLGGRLAAAGGSLNPKAERGMFVCLGLSILLNIAAATWPSGAWDLAAIGVLVTTALAHVLAPAAAAFLAWLIGVNDKSITDADPYRSDAWKKMPTIDALLPEDVMTDGGEVAASQDASAGASQTASPGASESTSRSASPVAWPVPVEGRTVLPIVARPERAEDSQEGADDASPIGQSFTVDLDEQRKSSAGVRRRPNPGMRASAKARKNPRNRRPTDDELRERLARLIETGALPPDFSLRQMQDALGIRFERAKRILSAASQTTSDEADENGETDENGENAA